MLWNETVRLQRTIIKYYQLQNTSFEHKTEIKSNK